jgi:hypothetical protein
MVAGLAGLGAGAAIAAAGAKSGEGKIEGPAAGAVLLAIPALAVAGYLLGRHYDRPIPLFLLAP